MIRYGNCPEQWKIELESLQTEIKKVGNDQCICVQNFEFIEEKKKIILKMVQPVTGIGEGWKGEERELFIFCGGRDGFG